MLIHINSSQAGATADLPIIKMVSPSFPLEASLPSLQIDITTSVLLVLDATSLIVANL